jgi:hypothetical protein
MVEFALVSVFLIPLLFGTVHVGMNITRSIQVTQVSRDAGHMYARYVDFSMPANQDIIVRLASGLGMTRTSGFGRVTLSKIMYVGDPECAAAGYTPPGYSGCGNRNHAVFLQQLVIGNQTLQASSFGTPSGKDAQGNVANYLTSSGARAQNFTTLLTLGPGEFAYVSEAYFRDPAYDFLGNTTGTAIYARTLF